MRIAIHIIAIGRNLFFGIILVNRLGTMTSQAIMRERNSGLRHRRPRKGEKAGILWVPCA